MKSSYTSVVGLVIALMLCSQPAFLQTSFTDCSPDPITRCVNDPGITLPDSNQLLVGVNTPGAVSCGVHVNQSRTLTSTCDGPVTYRVILIVDDTVEIDLQSLTSVTPDSNHLAVLSFDTRLAASATIRRNGLAYNEDCNEYHRVRWIATDNCGNEVTCEEQLNLYDCQEPVITTISGISNIHLPSCLLHLYASDFLVGILDDCSPESEFLLSMTPDSLVPDKILDHCEIGFNVETTFPIWIADEGFDFNCNNSIEWNERTLYRQDMPIILTEDGVCECFDTYTISGKIYTELQRPISGVSVTMEGQGTLYPTYETTQVGEYLFNDSSPFEDVTISASRNDDHRNGVTTLDIVKINKHILHIEELDSPYKIIAADANGSQSVSALDMIQLRKLILGIYDELPNSASWTFVDAKYDFAHPGNPWPTHSYRNIVIPYAEQLTDVDFIGVKVGDVNHTVLPNLASLVIRHDLPKVEFYTQDQQFAAGDLLDIPISISAAQALQGFQFTLEAAGLEIIGITSGACEIEEDVYFQMKDRMTMSWFVEKQVQLSKDDILFTIHAIAAQRGLLKNHLRISSDITPAELYDAAETIYEPVLSVQLNDEGVLLLPLTPNPASDHVIVPFYLPEAGQVSIRFTSPDNMLYKVVKVEGHAGRNEIPIHFDEVQHAGMIFCSLEAGGDVQYQKMMLMK